MQNFWTTLPHPFTILAPLDGVTDNVFREMMTRLGKPDVLFTEFTSVDGLCSEGFDRVIQRFKYESNQHPIVAQIWGIDPEKFEKSARIAKDLGFDGIDINMGCPDKTITKYGACSALIRNPELASEIIKATKKGAGGFPVSVKTRIGINEDSIEEWIAHLLKQDLAVLTVHLRTVKELSQVAAHWELMGKIMKLRDEIAPQTLIVGNGDITSLSEVEDKYREFGCEGFMIGRGIFANPWIFNKDIDPKAISPQTRYETYINHIALFEKSHGDRNFSILKKFCKVYIQGFDGASDAREKIMSSKTLSELKKAVREAKK